MAENEAAVTEAATVREIAITRVFDAPRELVRRAWTEPDQLARTEMSFHTTMQATDKLRTAAAAGLASAFDRLAEHLA